MQRWHVSPIDRYQRFAPVYDLFACEPVYRPGRLRGIADLRLQLGESVVDIGCGSGLNFEWLETAIGPVGRIRGVDLSPAMLGQAERRAVRHGWENVDLAHGDVTKVGEDDLRRLVGLDGPADAVLATYSLSVMRDPAAAWRAIKGLCGPATRVCIVDMRLPAGPSAVFAPLAALACRIGGSDTSSHPWTLLEHDADHLTSASLRGGHIQVRTGTLAKPTT